jgi:hypothetical protein
MNRPKAQAINPDGKRLVEQLEQAARSFVDQNDARTRLRHARYDWRLNA